MHVRLSCRYYDDHFTLLKRLRDYASAETYEDRINRRAALQTKRLERTRRLTKTATVDDY